MQRTKRWNIAEANPAADDLAARLKTSSVLAQVLLNRGLSDPVLCQEFLRPSLKMLHDPTLLANLTFAAERIARAIRDREKIFIYGDYDVDGITATAILWHAIGRLGGDIHYYIPHRLEEGYGLNSEAIGQICDSGARLIVTVDCGITAIEPVEVALQRGVDLIITDHHEWRELNNEISAVPHLPHCYAVVHPRLGSPAYPNANLCGAGVAFKLAWAIGQAVNGGVKVSDEFRAFLLDATALAALGTIADVVPLVGENRIIAHFGLKALKQTRLHGLAALIDSADLSGRNLDAYDVGFRLAPRLNASGRMGHANLAVEMLTHADAARATEIATYLEEQNRVRQGIERQILKEALEQIDALKLDRDDCFGVVLGAEGWHPGVIGIVASRIVDRLHRPTIMIALNDGIGQGSGRSIVGFHLARALSACDAHLQTHGGHEMAAGLKLDAARFEDFRQAFCAHASKMLTPEAVTPVLKLESLTELNQITEALASDFKRLGPFGQGNRRPLLACRGVSIAGTPRRVGKTGDHLQIQVRQGNSLMKCIAFNRGSMFDRLQSGTTIDIAVELNINEFNGYRNVELEVNDLQLVGG